MFLLCTRKTAIFNRDLWKLLYRYLKKALELVQGMEARYIGPEGVRIQHTLLQMWKVQPQP